MSRPWGLAPDPTRALPWTHSLLKKAGENFCRLPPGRWRAAGRKYGEAIFPTGVFVVREIDLEE